MVQRKYTWRPSLGDARDLPAPRNKLFLPSEVDLEDQGFAWLSPFDQGALGTCTANAISFCGWHYFASRYQALGEPFSRLFIYAKERDLEGTSLNEDSGAYGPDGFRTFRKWGAPLENQWPYVERQYTVEPPSSLYKLAARWRIPFYRHPAQTKRSIKSALSRGFPVAFGFTVYESFEGAALEQTGFMPMPSSSEQVLGGHEVVAVGYNSKYVKCRNSWGTSWGDHGYFYMPWEYILNAKLASEFRYFSAS